MARTSRRSEAGVEFAAEEAPIAGRLVDPGALDLDAPERSEALRPAHFAEFVGQARVREKALVFMEAARRRGEALDHVLLSGPPGVGKTTLAHIFAVELGVEITVTSGPILVRPGDLAAILTNLAPRAILFVDEIHRLNKVVEEVLYSALENFKLDIMLGKGPAAKTVRLDLPRFTLIGATTRAGMLSAPFRDRFGVLLSMDLYEEPDLLAILVRAAERIGIPLATAGASEIARRSRGTPRIALRLLRRVRDVAEVRFEGRIDEEAARAALDLLEIDRFGLDPIDRRILQVLTSQFQGRPVSLDTLAVAVNESSDTIYDMYEPFLIRQGFLLRTPQGRVAGPAAYLHLGLNPPKPREGPADLYLFPGDGDSRPPELPPE